MLGGIMLRKSRITLAEMVAMYERDHKTILEIAAVAGVGRQTVSVRLRRAGVNLSGKRTLKCDYCGIMFTKWRKAANKSNKHYCCVEHYYAQLGSSGYRPWRHGQRLARAVVSQLFALQPEHVVHHIDGDNRNNDRSNLLVFASQADHLAHHRGRKGVQPIWRYVG
jgi:hypothetical protein